MQNNNFDFQFDTVDANGVRTHRHGVKLFQFESATVDNFDYKNATHEEREAYDQQQYALTFQI